MYRYSYSFFALPLSQHTKRKTPYERVSSYDNYLSFKLITNP